MENTAHETKYPLFSVVIPTYNRATFLDRCLESLCNQTYKNFEVLVCDDGSTDNSKEVTEKYTNKLDIQYLWEPNWGGPARPRNRGIAVAKGEWICFLDSDDVWYSDKLMICKDYLEDYDLIYHNFMRNNGIDNHKELLSRKLPRDAFKDLMNKGNAIQNSSVCVRKNLLIAVSGLSEDKYLIAVEDFDLWIRISLLTSKFKYLPLALGEYWTGGGNITVSGLAHLEREKHVYNRYVDKLSTREKRFLNAKLLYREGLIFDGEGRRNDAKKIYKKAFWMGSNNLKIRILYRMLFTWKGDDSIFQTNAMSPQDISQDIVS